MSVIAVGGSGLNLPLNPNSLTWTGLNGTNTIDLPAASSWIIPAGTWIVTPGRYTAVQWYDPVALIWRGLGSWKRFVAVNSDGVNFRVANSTGSVLGAIMTNAGTGYTSAPTVTASAGGSTWQALINSSTTGFSLSDTVTVTGAGSGYTLPPIVLISPPAPGGIPATGVATLSTGTVSGITITNNGAGYFSAPSIRLIPNPLDPANNTGSIVTATATTALGTSGAVAALRCTYNGTAVTALPTLSFAGGGGASAAASVVGCFTITTVTVGTAGVALTAPVSINSIGGFQSATAAAGFKNPCVGTELLTVRTANIAGTGTTTLTGSTIIDGGLFHTAPTPQITQGIVVSGSLPTTAPAATFAIGGVTDTFEIQATL